MTDFDTIPNGDRQMTFYRIYSKLTPLADWLVSVDEAIALLADIHPACRPYIVTETRS
jgi:hypothetical protein